MLQTHVWSNRYLFGFQPSNHAVLGSQHDEEDQYWVVGDQFLQLYYTTFDWPGKRIGLVEANVAAGTFNPKRAFQYVIFFTLCFVVLSGFCCFCCCCCRPCRKKLKKIRRKKMNQKLTEALNNVGQFASSIGPAADRNSHGDNADCDIDEDEDLENFYDINQIYEEDDLDGANDCNKLIAQPIDDDDDEDDDEGGDP